MIESSFEKGIVVVLSSYEVTGPLIEKLTGNTDLLPFSSITPNCIQNELDQIYDQLELLFRFSPELK